LPLNEPIDDVPNCSASLLRRLSTDEAPAFLAAATALSAVDLSQTTNRHTFNSPLSRNTRVSRYQMGNTNLDFTEARDSEWQWHQLGHMQVCT